MAKHVPSCKLRPAEKGVGGPNSQITNGGVNTMARILVVDDVKEAVDAIRKVLEKQGHDILGYTDELEAIDDLKNHPVDLAILDIKLKKMDGVEVLGRVKEIQPDIKVIMLTGYPTHASVEQAMRIGASAYCMKPIDRKELEKKVEEVLGQTS